MDLPEFSIADAAEALGSGQLSETALCRAYEERIALVDRAGPTLGAVLELAPDLEEQAQACERERRAQRIRGPLHGVPVLLKDCIDTAGGMQTTAGSLALAGHRAKRDAWVVERLRAAGAILLGKANMSEWGFMRSLSGVSGWSSRGGQTRNPYALDRSPSGSSSGSAVGVAANLCTVAIGAETDGSIVRPASINGIVGLKPTVGLLGRSGIIPVAHSQDTPGPMARTVTDVATVLSALVGVDPRDASTHEARPHRLTDYLIGLETGGLQGARIGIARSYFGLDAGVDAVLEDAIAALRDLGATVVDPVPLARLPLPLPAEVTIFLYEFKHDINRYLDEHPDVTPRTLEDLIRFNQQHAEQVMPHFGQEIFEFAQSMGDLANADYRAARDEAIRVCRTEGIDKVMRDYELDAIAGPTDSMPAWPIDYETGDRVEGGCSTMPAIAGYPHITVPAGYTRGLPVALSFFAGAWEEPRLLRYAYAFEQGTQHRRAPTYPSSIS